MIVAIIAVIIPQLAGLVLVIWYGSAIVDRLGAIAEIIGEEVYRG